jgi:hypothetical protein
VAGELSSSALTFTGGGVSGSSTSTGSFGRVEAYFYVGDFHAIAANEEGHFSSSMQVGGGTYLDDEPSLLSANRICGSCK